MNLKMLEKFLDLFKFLYRIVHTLKEILKPYQSSENHTRRHDIEPESVRETDQQASEPQGTPTLDQKPEIASEPEKQSTLLVCDAPCSCKKPENPEIDDPMASEKTTENYVEMLEEDHKAMRYDIFEFQQKFGNLNFIITGLEGIQYENDQLKEEIATMRATASDREKQNRIHESQITEDNINLQKNLDDLEKENKSLVCKLSVMEQNQKQVLEPNPQAANEALRDRSDAGYGLKPEVTQGQQDHHMKSTTPFYTNYPPPERAASLLKTSSQWNSHCQSEEFRLISENTDLKKKLQALQDENQSYISLKTAELRLVTEDNQSLKSTLDLAIETLNAKLYLLDELKIELHDLKIKQAETFTIQEENEDLKKQLTSLRETESKLSNDKENLESRLQALYSKNGMIIDAKNATEKSLQQEEALVQEKLAIIDLLESELELANKTINEKMRIIDQLEDDLTNLRKVTSELQTQNNEMRQSMTGLEESVRKRKSDWRSNELMLRENNDELKKKLGRLQTENQRLLEKNSLLRDELESAHKEMLTLREVVVARDQSLIEFCKKAEKLAENERMAESSEAAPLPAQEPELVEEHSVPIQLLMTGKTLSTQEISGQPSSKSDSDIDINYQTGEEINELRAKLRGLETETKNLRSEMVIQDQAEVESRRAIRNLKMKNQLDMDMSKAAIESTHRAELAAEEQVAALSEALTALKEAVANATEVAETKKNDKLGTADLVLIDADTSEKKNGSRFKEWLKKREFRWRKTPQDPEPATPMQNTGTLMIQRAKELKKLACNLKEKDKDLQKKAKNLAPQ